MPVIRGASSIVIRCFKRVEKCADTLTGAAGPVFIFLAWLLTGFIGFSFFDVVARDLSWPVTLLLLPLYILVPANMYVQYYLVTHINGGFPGATSAKELRWITPNPGGILAPERWGFHRRGKGTVSPRMPKAVRRCRKCNGPKPERAHHCSVCNRCVLLMDHHCPWIDACVGLHNQRHFVLFMLWLSFGATIFAILGYPHFWPSIDIYGSEWNAYTPRILFTLGWVLSLACGLAVAVLGLWHLFMVSRGETSIESHDNSYLEKKAAAEGLIYLNPFDLGRRRNLENFFNVGPGGYSKLTLLFPLVVPPYTSGWSYPRRSLPEVYADDAAFQQQHEHDHQHADERDERNASASAAADERLVGDGPGGMYIMGGGDELTDDEGGGGGWWGEDDENDDTHPRPSN